MNNVIPFKNDKADRIKLLIREKLMRVLELDKLDPIADMSKYYKIEQELSKIQYRLEALGYKAKEHAALVIKENGQITAN